MAQKERPLASLSVHPGIEFVAGSEQEMRWRKGEREFPAFEFSSGNVNRSEAERETLQQGRREILFSMNSTSIFYTQRDQIRARRGGRHFGDAGVLDWYVEETKWLPTKSGEEYHPFA